ncbi:MAG: dicarboxylate/amino acid:cation symporter [Holosporales bacterium]|nr:dicarboxylate/amino acid:cation symporter [Holosporales bacterium]
MSHVKRLKRFGMPIVFLASLAFSLLFGGLVSYEVRSFMYAVSLTIKELLVFSLPFVVFALIFNSITKLGVKALGYVLVVVVLVCTSNFMNTMLSYLISIGVPGTGIDTTLSDVDSNQELLPMFTTNIGTLVSNDVAMICGASLGILLVLLKGDLAEKLSSVFSIFTRWFFKILMPLIPVFIMGTAVKLQHDGMLAKICQQYLPILVIFVISAYGYVVLQYMVLSAFRVEKCSEYIRNILPAMVTAFGSMSSTAAMPLSIQAAEKNLDEKCNAGIIVPATTSIHLVGDCFFLPLVAVAVMMSFGMACPSFADYLPFAIHFVLAKFAVAAVPGGGVLVMIPVMQKYLGMSSEMLALVTALYILFDPLITTCNVAGNGALAIMFDRIVRALRSSKRSRCQT